MRFIVTLALSFAAVVAAAPQAPRAGALAARQQCTVDCTCLAEDRTRSWPDTQRCCAPNGGTLDNPAQYCRGIPFDTAEAGFGGCCGGDRRFECRTVICPESGITNRRYLA